MEILLTIIFALLGASIGSFLNVCVDRLPQRKSLAYPPSHCDSCQHRLAPIDLVPVFSYLWLRGRCRYCQARIPMRSLGVEVLSGVVFAVAYWRYGLSLDFAATAFYSSIFIAILFIDLEHKLILNRVTYPAALAALGISLFYHPLTVVNISMPWSAVGGGVTGVVNSLIGGAAGFAFFLLAHLITSLIYSRESLGLGDVKMAGLIGLVNGFPLVFVSLFIGIFVGGVVAILALLFRMKGRKDVLPYGAFLAFGPIITLLWGADVLRWYLGLA